MASATNVTDEEVQRFATAIKDCIDSASSREDGGKFIEELTKLYTHTVSKDPALVLKSLSQKERSLKLQADSKLAYTIASGIASKVRDPAKDASMYHMANYIYSLKNDEWVGTENLSDSSCDGRMSRDLGRLIRMAKELNSTYGGEICSIIRNNSYIVFVIHGGNVISMR